MCMTCVSFLSQNSWPANLKRIKQNSMSQVGYFLKRHQFAVWFEASSMVWVFFQFQIPWPLRRFQLCLNRLFGYAAVVQFHLKPNVFVSINVTSRHVLQMSCSCFQLMFAFKWLLCGFQFQGILFWGALTNESISSRCWTLFHSNVVITLGGLWNCLSLVHSCFTTLTWGPLKH